MPGCPNVDRCGTCGGDSKVLETRRDDDEAFSSIMHEQRLGSLA
jgi:hypothetical protein